MAVAEPTLRERIGGRWAVSWQFFAIFIPASSITLAATIGSGTPGLSPWLLGASALISGFVGALVPLAAALTVLRDRVAHPVPIWVVAVVGMLTGLVREITLRVVFAGFGEAFPGEWVPRLPVAMLLIAILMITTALFLDELDRLRMAIAALDERAVQLRSLEQRSDALTADLVAAVEERVEPAMIVLDDAARGSFDAAGRDPRAVARRLQAIVDDELRPLSAQLYALEAVPLPELRMRTVVAARLRAQPVTPLAAMALYLPTTLFVSTQWQSFSGSLAASSINTLILGSALLVVALLARRGVLTGFALPVGILLAIAGTTAKIVLLPSVEGTQAIARLAVGNAVWVALLVVITGLAGAALTGRSRQLPEIRASLDEREVERLAASRELVRVSRELANQLHGRLQSTLLAAAFAIENAARSGDDAAVDRALEEARIALREVAVDVKVPASDLAEELERRAALWRGFVEIRIDVADGVGADLPTVGLIGELAEEAIANARKHGGARAIWIEVDAPTPGQLRLAVRDDGRAGSAGAPGVGSRRFDAAAPGAWSLRPVPDGPGSVLELRLATPDGG